MLYNHTICLQNGGYPVKKQAIALLLAAVLVLSGCGRQQLPEETRRIWALPPWRP